MKRLYKKKINKPIKLINLILVIMLILTAFSSLTYYYDVEQKNFQKDIKKNIDYEYSANKNNTEIKSLSFNDYNNEKESNKIVKNNDTANIKNSEKKIYNDNDRFKLLPKEGQNKIINRGKNLEGIRLSISEKLQNLKNWIIDRLSSRISHRTSEKSVIYKLFKLSDPEKEKLSNIENTEKYDKKESDINNLLDSEKSKSKVKTRSISENYHIQNDKSKEDTIIIPDSGHILFVGQGNSEFNNIFDINGTQITIDCELTIGPESSSVEIWWNLYQGFFKIIGDGYFEFSDLYINVNNSITFSIDSLIIDSNGYLMIDHNGFEGDIYLDGILVLDGLEFDIDHENIFGFNVSLKATLDFSKIGEADDLSISWNENGISTDGDYVGSSKLIISEFNLNFNDFFVIADLMNFRKSAYFVFEENDFSQVVFCNINSNNIYIEGLYLGKGDFGLYIDSIQINNNIEFELELIDPENYITEEQGHISIGGCFALAVDNSINVYGTIIKISGVLRLDYGYLDIEWDKSEGFFKISTTKMVEIDDFSISIDGDWISLYWDQFIIYKDGHLLIEKQDDLNNSAHLEMFKCSELVGFHISGEIGDITAGLSIGSILFIDGSLFDLTLYENTVVMDLDGSVGYGLIIHDLSLEVATFEIEIKAIIVMGTWHLFYDDSKLEIETEGFIEILNFSLSNNADGAEVEVLGAGYFVASGETDIQVIEGKFIIGLYSMESFLKIGSVPFIGSLNMELYGSASLIIDLVNGAIYGQISGYGTLTTGNILMGAIVVNAISATFNGEASFALIGNMFYLSINVEAYIRANLLVDLNSMLFDLENFRLAAHGSIYGFIGAAISASVNLATGQTNICGNVGGIFLVKINSISGYGEGVWKRGDVNDDDITDFYLYIDEILVDFSDININAAVGFSINIETSNVHIGHVTVWGTVEGSATIKGFNFYAESSNSPLPGELIIDYIQFDADFTIGPSIVTMSMVPLLLLVNGSASVNIENLNYSFPSGFSIDINSTYIDTGFLEICFDSDGDIGINATGAIISLSNILFGGDTKVNIGNLALGAGEIKIFINRYLPGAALEIDVRDGFFTVENVEIPIMQISLDGLEITLDANVKVHEDKTIEANCAGTLILTGFSFAGNTYNSLTVEFGFLIIYPPEEEGKPPVFDVNGGVQINGDLDGDGKEDINGSIYVDGAITVDWEKDESGIWFVDIIFDSTDEDYYGVYIQNFNLDVIIPGVDWPVEVNIENYWGTGMFEFSIDLNNNLIFMDNQMFAVWEDFNFDINNGLLSGEIYHFQGDLTLSNIEVQIDGNPIWGIDSNNGYLTYIGFDFSTDINDDFEFIGDIEIDPEFPPFLSNFEIHITSMYLEAGTEGTFEIYNTENDPGTLYLSLECNQGNAAITSYIPIDGINFWFNLDTEEGITHVPIPMEYLTNLISLAMQLKQGIDWDIVSDTIDLLLDQDHWENIETLQLINDFFDNVEFLGITFNDGSTLTDILNELDGQIPDWLLEKLAELFDRLSPDSCFLKGTKIEMANGQYKYIEDIQIGDEVASYDMMTQEWKTGIVTNVYHHSANEMTDYYMLINNDLKVTPNHPLYLNHQWIDAGNLNVGDIYGGNIIYSIKKIFKQVPTYNFEVEPYHTYNIIWGSGKRSIVHNENTEENLANEAVTGDKFNSCFLRGTKIEMSNGSGKNIEEIKVGDQVRSYDSKSGQLKIGTVSNVFHHSPSEMTDYYLVINNDLKVTPNHPVFVNGILINAGDLRLGDYFGEIKIYSIDKVFSRVPTYNFEVEPYHTYNVIWGKGKTSIVHNEGEDEDYGDPIASIAPGGWWADKSACFIEDTKISMFNGTTKDIEDIEVGDDVYSYDFENKTWKNATVTEVEHHSPHEMPSYYLVINNDLKVTPNHPVYVDSDYPVDPRAGASSNKDGNSKTAVREGSGKWIAAGSLQVGFMLDGQLITSIRQVYHRVPSYNIKVEPYHNFRVVWGSTSSLAHHNESLMDNPNPEPVGGYLPSTPSVPDRNVEPPNGTDPWNPWGDKNYSLSPTTVNVPFSNEYFGSYSPHNCLSGRYYGAIDVADAGIPSNIKGNSVDSNPASFKMTPKTMENEYGKTIIIDGDQPYPLQDGSIVEISYYQKWKVTNSDDGTYGLSKDGKSIKKGLESTSDINECINSYARKSNKKGLDSSSNSSSNSLPANNSDSVPRIVVDYICFDESGPVDMTDGIPIQFTSGNSFISFGNYGVSATTQIFVIDKKEPYEDELKELLDERLHHEKIGGKTPGDPIPPIPPDMNIRPIEGDTNPIGSFSFNIIDDNLISLFSLPPYQNPLVRRNPLDNNNGSAIRPPDGKNTGDPSIIPGDNPLNQNNDVNNGNSPTIGGVIGGNDNPNIGVRPIGTSLIDFLPKLMDHVYYPAESIEAGDIIRGYNQESGRMVDASVSEVTMTLVEGKYVEIELTPQGKLQNYQQQLENIDNYQEQSKSDLNGIAVPYVKSEKSMFLGKDQLIYTTDGLIPAAELEIGDEVISHNTLENLVISSVELKRRVIPVYNITLGIPITADSNKTENLNKENEHAIEEKITVDYSTHCYFADDIIVGDYLANNNINYNYDDNTCFVSGTDIAMVRSKGTSEIIKSVDYYKKIEDVQVGDIVYSFNTLNNHANGAKVLDITKHKTNGYLEIYYSIDESYDKYNMYSLFDGSKSLIDQINENKDESVLKTTLNHPIYIYSNSKYLSSKPLETKPAGKLRAGDRMFLINGKYATVKSVQIVQEPIETFNLEVEIYHNYFADDILVSDKQEVEDSADEPPDKLRKLGEIGHEIDEIPDSIENSKENKNSNEIVSFGYYNEINHYNFNGRDSRENSLIQKSKARLSEIIINFIQRIVEGFPILEKIKFFQHFLNSQEAEEIIDWGKIEDTKNPDDQSSDTQKKKSENSEDLNHDENMKQEDRESSNQEDKKETFPEKSQDDSNKNQRIYPIKQQMTNSLQTKLLSIIEESRENEDESIHYIWDFGDGNYKYGKNVVHFYDTQGLEENNLDNTEIGFSRYDETADTQEKITYLATLMMVDNLGNIIDMDMTTITIFKNWESNLDYQLLPKNSFIVY